MQAVSDRKIFALSNGIFFYFDAIKVKKSVFIISIYAFKLLDPSKTLIFNTTP